MRLQERILAMQDQFNDLRRILSIVETDNFAYLYSMSRNKTVADAALDALNIDTLLEWIQNERRLQRDYHSMTVKELRRHCYRLGIRNYSCLTKDQLVTEIIDVERSRSLGDNS